MPKRISGLSKSLKKKIPKHAQEIYVKSFNNAFKRYKDPKKRRGKQSRDEAANKTAWAAVKRKYRKGKDGKWHKKRNGSS
jgi:cation transport regulator